MLETGVIWLDRANVSHIKALRKHLPFEGGEESRAEAEGLSWKKLFLIANHFFTSINKTQTKFFNS